MNGIEGFWGHFKKGIEGTNVGVSKKHMWKHIAGTSIATISATKACLACSAASFRLLNNLV